MAPFANKAPAAEKKPPDPVDEPPDSPCPATYALAASWVLVYLAMLVIQGKFPLESNPLRFGGIEVETAHRFGDLTARAFASGQVWRTVTASFIHFGLLHLVINTIGLIQFGRVLEEWYGSSLFLAIYVAIAAVGNSLAAGSRILLKGSLDVHAAGGSSVLFGLVGLIFVAGWRMKSRSGDYMRRQMFWKLIIYGVLAGVVGHSVLDNFGHAGGALAGAMVGFADPILFQVAGKLVARAAAVVATLVLASCVTAQAVSTRAELDAIRRERAFQDVAWTGVFVEQMEQRKLAPGPYLSDPLAASRRELSMVLRRLDADLKGKPLPVEAEIYSQWRKLAGLEATAWMKDEQIREFSRLYPQILQAAAKAAGKEIRTVKPPAGPGRFTVRDGRMPCALRRAINPPGPRCSASRSYGAGRPIGPSARPRSRSWSRSGRGTRCSSSR